jgi:hypothetical protein
MFVFASFSEQASGAYRVQPGDVQLHIQSKVYLMPLGKSRGSHTRLLTSHPCTARA